ncbi:MULTISPECIES: hypothetical protein [unclassified Caballeronia]|uniref:hypothetical protein n=1 Tax=unclassified Caballeronia TaxID=2646786 RepID=UPI0013EDC094|nr:MULTISPECIES: hypothetical protein [unclassified Caballeronia]
MSPELRPIKCVATAALCLVSGLAALGAFAQAGGQPLILDTQTGIHSGAGGNVLQTGPLNGSGMVPARALPTLPELPQKDQQTIIVSPYIDLQQGGHRAGQGYGASTSSQSSSFNRQHRPRSTSSHLSASYGVPTGSQTQAPASTQSAVSQVRQSPAQPPIITPVPVATPRSVATPSPAPTVPTRSSDPHTATGAVTTSLD